MIRAIIFDLDGVLMQTEKLKSLAYAKAVQFIRDLPEPDLKASEAYGEVIGASREITSKYVMDKLVLEDELHLLMDKYDVTKPVDVLTAVRYEIYDDMIKDPQVVRDNQWPHIVDVLKVAKENFCKTGLATLSKRKDVMHVIDALGLKDSLDVIVTAEDVSKGKPDPEIYLLAAQKLGVPPEECLVLEDSVNGVKAALAAGTNVVAIANPFTKRSLMASKVIEDQWVVKELSKVGDMVRRRIQEHERTAHKDGSGNENVSGACDIVPLLGLGSIIVPAMIAKTQGELDTLLDRLRGKVSRVQLDVMDGKFVSNTSLLFDFRVPYGFEYEAHLMISNPLEWIEQHAQQVSIVVVHVETLDDIPSLLSLAKKKGLKVYLSLKPETDVDVILPYIGILDGIQIMTVDPGNYCEMFLPEPLEKIRAIRRISKTIPVEVDGCMDPQTVKLAKDSGANVFATGSYILRNEDVDKAVKELQDAAT